MRNFYKTLFSISILLVLAGCATSGESENQFLLSEPPFGDKMKFPTVQGSNLLRQKKTLPQDFEGEINLVFVPFKQWQQSEVNSWVSWVLEMEAKYPGLMYYELPTIENRNKLYQTFINEGMRAGIPNPLARERTITLYLSKSEFQKTLEMPDEEHIYVLLLDNEGNILTRVRGPFAEESSLKLSELIASRIMPIKSNQEQNTS